MCLVYEAEGLPQSVGHGYADGFALYRIVIDCEGVVGVFRGRVGRQRRVLCRDVVDMGVPGETE